MARGDVGTLTVVYVDDEADVDHVALLQTALGDDIRVSATKNALDALGDTDASALFLDLGFPEQEEVIARSLGVDRREVMGSAAGIAILKQLRARRPHLPIIVLTSDVSTDILGACSNEHGAWAHIDKGDLLFGRVDLVRLVRNAVAVRELEAVPPTPQGASSRRDTLIAESPAMRAMLKRALRLAMAERPMLFLGETGCGKEEVAAYLHKNSPRRGKPFHAVDCGAIGKELLGDALFGHVRGAYTGAPTGQAGAFETAHGGTLFLDEIGNASPEVQVALLRVLETQAVMRLGSQEARKVDVLVFSSTSRDLHQMIKRGEFREDLFFRLGQVIEIPPLRDRPEDVPALARSFTAMYAERDKRPWLSLSDGALAKLRRSSWPGNVRELQNVIKSTVALTMAASIEEDDIQLEADASAPKWDRVAEGLAHAIQAGDAAALAFLSDPRPVAYEVLYRLSGRDKARMAAALGMKQNALHMQLKRMYEARVGTLPPRVLAFLEDALGV